MKKVNTPTKEKDFIDGGDQIDSSQNDVLGKVIDQIQSDLNDGDHIALWELLSFLPVHRLNNYLEDHEES